MKELTIEIHGAGTWNRGGELMAIAAGERVRSMFPNARIVVPLTFGTARDRRKYGFWGTWEERKTRFRTRLRRLVLAYGPPGTRWLSGVVRPSSIDVVLDASGFSFSDQWGPKLAMQLLERMDRPGRRHQKLILLPQAFGPFNDPTVAEATRRLFGRASLVCARDRTSYQAAKDLGGARRLIQSPDFTVGVKAAEVPSGIRLPERFVAIVPNYRMMDKVKDPGPYLAFLGRSIDLLRNLGAQPIIVLHDQTEDRKVAAMVNEKRSLKVVEHEDPRVIKGVLRQADFVISSRFHALVSALSQGVPCIGAGWSHKYPELFEQFGVADCLAADLKDEGFTEAMLRKLVEPAVRDGYRSRLLVAAGGMCEANDRMWAEVAGLIRGT